jgi:predicted RNA-binding protein YlqC (UPF0109 family)
MIEFFKKLFAGPANSASPSPSSGPNPSAGAAPTPTVQTTAVADGEGIEGFVLYVIRALVDNPDSVRVTTAETERATVLTVSCEKKDIGKIIGKSGRTIAAIRALANGAGGRMGKRVNVEVQD